MRPEALLFKTNLPNFSTMKTLITILATAAGLATAIALSGFAFDAAVVVSICFAAGIAGVFTSDYSRTTSYHLEAAKAPARAFKRARPARADVEFATFATFHTMVG